MDRERAAQLKRGDEVVVRWGIKGTQVAEVLGPMNDSGWVPMRKYRRNSRTWTNRVYLHHNMILGAPGETAST